jgi:hypothetical protein
LDGQDRSGLEAQVVLEVLSDLAHLQTVASAATVCARARASHQSLEGQLAEQQIGRLLILADLAKCHGARAVAAGLLLLVKAPRGAPAGGHGGQLLAWRSARARSARTLVAEAAAHATSAAPDPRHAALTCHRCACARSAWFSPSRGEDMVSYRGVLGVAEVRFLTPVYRTEGRCIEGTEINPGLTGGVHGVREVIRLTPMASP